MFKKHIRKETQHDIKEKKHFKETQTNKKQTPKICNPTHAEDSK